MNLEEVFSKLPQEDWAHVFEVFDQVGGDYMQAMDILKPWFQEPGRAAYLNARGMDAGFMGYWLPFQIGQNTDIFRQAYSQLVGAGWPIEDSMSESC